MSEFFRKSLDEQVEIVTNYKNVKLLQVLLGTEHCQLWEDWLAHCLMAYKLVGVTQILKYQLPMNIITVQDQILAQNFQTTYRSLPSAEELGSREDADELLVRWHDAIKKAKFTADQAKMVTKKLKDAEKKVEEKYQTWRRMPEGMYDPVRNFMFSYDGTDVQTENENVAAVVQAFKHKVSLQPVLKIDVSDLYCEIYNEVCREIENSYSLDIKEGDSIYDLCNGNDSLMSRMKKFSEDNERLRSILSNISEKVLKGIADKEFIKEVYEALIDQILDDAEVRSDHPLKSELKKCSRDEIKSKFEKLVKSVRKSEILKKCMENIAIKKEPDLNSILILLANGASLHGSYIKVKPLQNDSQITKELETISVKEQFERLGEPYTSLMNMSIFTVTKKAHDLLFDFSMAHEGIDLLSLVSKIPNEDGKFVENAENMMIFTKLGNEGEQQFMSLLKNCSKYINKKSNESSTIEAIIEFFSKKPSAEQRQEALQKLYKCFDVGYLAIRSGSDQVIFDYITEIKDEARKSKNPYLKKLFENFTDIIHDCEDLPKSMFCAKWVRYFTRYITWTPEWEKLFKNTPYDSDVREWSKAKFDEIIACEKEAEAAFMAQIREKNKKLKDEKEKKTVQRRQTMDITNLMLEVSQIFTQMVILLGDLMNPVVASQSQIVKAVLDFMEQNNVSSRAVLEAIFQEVRLNADHVKSSGNVSNDLIRLALNNVQV